MAKFLKQIVKNPLKTGGFGPCSPQVVKLTLSLANLKDAKTVVEFGPGTGVFTGEILKDINDDCLFFAVEINPDFVQNTREKHPEAIVYEDSAGNFGKYLKEHGKNQCDVIISSLPWSLLTKNNQLQILGEVDKYLKPGGEFLTVSYLFARPTPQGIQFKKRLKRHFEKVKSSRIAFSHALPMFIYHCRKAE